MYIYISISYSCIFFNTWYVEIKGQNVNKTAHIKFINTVCLVLLKPMHSIGKVSVNASILYNNQKICNKTNLWKFQLISFTRKQ